MNLRAFQSEDLAQLNLWRAARSLPPVSLGSLPATGFVVPGVAAGFLYKMDCDGAFAEGFNSNPAVPKATRQAALNQVATAVADEARKCGFRVLYGLIKRDDVAKRSVAHGFKPLGPVLFVEKEL